LKLPSDLFCPGYLDPVAEAPSISVSLGLSLAIGRSSQRTLC
jgi:hypothetical protein